MTRTLLPVLLLASLFLAPGAVQAQEPAQGGGESALRVYLDCATWRCSEDRFRQEITWVTWVREPQDADLYILLTGERAGGDGFRYSFDFEGRGELEGLSDRYLHTSSATDVEEEVVEALTRTISAALVRFAALAGYTDRLEITGIPASEAPARAEAQEEADDPWNAWVFSTRFNAEIEREDREERDQFRINLSANRTTEMWKLDWNGNIDFSRREVQFESGNTFVDEREDWSTRALVVRSLSPHWSTGFLTRAGTSTRYNRDFAFEFSPAVEWNYFPWQESTRRRFVVLYTIGLDILDYEEVTIYQQTKETLFQQRLDVAFRQQESWGNASVGAEARQFLNHTDQFSLEFRANLDYRLIRGLGLNIGADYEVIRDQRFLSGEGLTPEEVLVSRRELATGSRFSVDVGISYRFGSIFNNVVNSRFPSLR